MGKNIKVYLFVMLFSFAACNSQRSLKVVWCEIDTVTDSERVISFHQLYTLKDLHRKTVTVEGFFSYSFEDVALYPRPGSGGEGAWLSFKSRISDSLLRGLHGKKIAVTGEVDTTDKGHLNSCYCTIYNISCIRE